MLRGIQLAACEGYVTVVLPAPMGSLMGKAIDLDLGIGREKGGDVYKLTDEKKAVEGSLRIGWPVS